LLDADHSLAFGALREAARKAYAHARHDQPFEHYNPGSVSTVVPQDSGRQPQPLRQRSISRNARHEAVREQAHARKTESNAAILAAFPTELTASPTARELAAITGLAQSTVSLRLNELIAADQLVRDADGIHRPWPGRRSNWESARAAGEQPKAVDWPRTAA
jgi:hypothetical protein